MKRTCSILPAVALLTGLITTTTAQDLMITGVMDGTLTGGTPKTVELYARNDIPDLSRYAISRAGNGSSTFDAITAEFILPAIALNAGDFYYAVGNSFGDQTADFDTVWPAYSGIRSLNYGVNSNGNDVTGLFHDATGAFTGSETLIDVMGELGVDGTGTAWDHLDGWAYSKSGRSPSATFNANEWDFSGPNAMDGFTPQQIADSFPDQTYTPTVVTSPPTISAIEDQSIPADSTTGPVAFTVDDFQTAASNLVVSATSDNPALVPNNPANLVLSGSDAARTIEVIPAAGQQGVANIEVVVTDEDLDTATNVFSVTVGLPFISEVPNQIAPTNITSIGPISFTVGDNETAAGSLIVTADSSDPLVANASLGGGGSNRTVTVTLTGTPGFSIITLHVNDGTFDVTTDFYVTAYPTVGIVLSDDFDYPDGPIVSNLDEFSFPIWEHHSGAVVGEVQVVDGKMQLTSTQTEDVNTILDDHPSLFPPFDATGAYVLFTRFTVNFSALPTQADATYFAHMREATGGNFQARVFVGTLGAPAGYYRMGIWNFSGPTVYLPRDLATNVTYVVVTRYNTVTGESTLWVNPLSESDSSVDGATIPATPATVYTYAFREDSGFGGIGTLEVDDLVIGTSFDDVVIPVASEPLQHQVNGGNLILSWSSPLLVLQSATDVKGPYTDVAGSSSPFTNALSADQVFFRLKY